MKVFIFICVFQTLQGNISVASLIESYNACSDANWRCSSCLNDELNTTTNEISNLVSIIVHIGKQHSIVYYVSYVRHHNRGISFHEMNRYIKFVFRAFRYLTAMTGRRHRRVYVHSCIRC